MVNQNIEKDLGPTRKMAVDSLSSDVGLVFTDRPQDLGVCSYLWVVNLRRRRKKNS